jgi:hypothetical protein
MNSSLVGLTLIAFGTAAAFAIDLLDAPGPGYRNQLESRTYRPDLLDALPSTLFWPEERTGLENQFLQKVEQFWGVRLYTSPLILTLEIQQLNPTILELPTENPFEHPFRLFTYPGDTTKRRGHIFRDQ